MSTPSWWAEADTEAVEGYRVWESTDWYQVPLGDMDPEEWSNHPTVIAGQERLNAFVDAHADEWCCRRCRFWRSVAGQSGGCGILRMTTRHLDVCEEWQPLVLPAQIQTELAL